MKKTGIFLVIVTLSITFLYFSINIILKKYFNEEYYSTPNLVGLTLQQGKETLKNYPLELIFVSEEISEAPINTIFIQEPKANKIVKKDRKIRVWISKGTDDRIIPNVAGLNLIDAKALIQSQGFKIGEVSTISSTLPVGTVIATDPQVNSSASKDKPVSFLVNDATVTSSVKMPDLLGLSLEDAKIVLKDNSLILGEIILKKQQGLEKGIIIDTDIQFNKSIPTGTTVNLTVSE